MIDPRDFLSSHPPVVKAGLNEHSRHSVKAENSVSCSDFNRSASASQQEESDSTPFHTQQREDSFNDKRRAQRRRARLRKERRRQEIIAGGNNGNDLLETDSKTEENDCFDCAVSSLSAAGASTAMLRHRLESKGFEQETIDAVIPRLADAGLLDDEQFANDLLERCLHRLLGPIGVRREFCRKGINHALADRLIEKANDEGRFIDCARNLVRQVARQSPNADKQKLLRRLASRAASRGLPMGLVRQSAADLLGI